MSALTAADFDFFQTNPPQRIKAIEKQNSGIEQQVLLDGKFYRLQHATHQVYLNNHHNTQLKKSITAHITKNLAELHEAYAAESALTAVNNARRIALENIRRDVAEPEKQKIAEGPFATLFDATKIGLGLTNLVRIFWVFVRFDLNEFVRVFQQLCACMGVVDEAQLMSFLDIANNTLWNASVALFALRLVIELGLALKHIVSPQGDFEQSLSWQKRALMEWHKRWSDCANYITWGMVNAFTNFPEAFGIPLWACFPIVAGVLLFDVWIAYRKHTETKVKIASALALVQQDKDEVLSQLGKNDKDFELKQLEEMLTSEKDENRLAQLQKLNVYLQEEKALKDKLAMQHAIFHWREKSALVVFGAFSMSVLAPFAAMAAAVFAFPPLAPLLIGGLTLSIVAFHCYREYAEKGEHFSFKDYLNNHKLALSATAAFTLSVVMATAFFPPAVFLICYMGVSLGIVGYYKEATLTEKDSFSAYKELRKLQQEAAENGDAVASEKFKVLAERTRFRICVDIAAWAILPPVLIGSLAVCWPLTIAAGAAILGYAAYVLYRSYHSGEEANEASEIKSNRYQLFTPVLKDSSRSSDTAINEKEHDSLSREGNMIPTVIGSKY